MKVIILSLEISTCNTFTNQLNIFLFVNFMWWIWYRNVELLPKKQKDEKWERIRYGEKIMCGRATLILMPYGTHVMSMVFGWSVARRLRLPEGLRTKRGSRGGSGRHRSVVLTCQSLQTGCTRWWWWWRRRRRACPADVAKEMAAEPKQLNCDPLDVCFPAFPSACTADNGHGPDAPSAGSMHRIQSW